MTRAEYDGSIYLAAAVPGAFTSGTLANEPVISAGGKVLVAAALVDENLLVAKLRGQFEPGRIR